MALHSDKMTPLLQRARLNYGTFSAMLSILSDTQKAVLDTVTMRLDLTNSLDYVKHCRFPNEKSDILPAQETDSGHET